MSTTVIFDNGDVAVQNTLSAAGLRVSGVANAAVLGTDGNGNIQASGATGAGNVVLSTSPTISKATLNGGVTIQGASTQTGKATLNGGAYITSIAAGVNTRNSSATLDSTAKWWVYTGGAGSTFKFPPVIRTAGSEFVIYNRGSGALKIAATGADKLYSNGAALPEVTLTAGASITAVDDGAYWLIK